MPLASIFLNVSGAGKTRIAFEGLLLNWGLYITFSDFEAAELPAHSAHGRGSSDLKWVINEMTGMSQWNTQPKHDGAFVSNQDVATRCFAMLLVARLAVLLLFLQSVPNSWSEADCRKEWVIVQAAPLLAAANIPGMKGTDIFQYVTERARFADLPTLKAVITSFWREIANTRWFKEKRDSDHPFFMVWDEAQVGVSRQLEGMKDHFRSETDSSIPRPLLSALLKAMVTFGFLERFIICGTGLSMEATTKALASNSLLPTSTITRSEAGSFDKNDVEEFITKHLPELKKPIHRQFILRCREWFLGRYVQLPCCSSALQSDRGLTSNFQSPTMRLTRRNCTHHKTDFVASLLQPMCS